MDERPINPKRLEANPGYSVYQISRALTTAAEHEDAATRERARERAARWAGVLKGMLTGSLDVGSRTPVGGVPGWVTLEVMTGGFTTGAFLAGGPVQEHEKSLLARLEISAENVRRALNSYYLSDVGLGELRERLLTGCYDVAVPEEGALLVVAWLVEKGEVEAARTLLEQLGAYISELRFYPIATETARPSGSQVFLQDVAGAKRSLEAIVPSERILAQKEAIEIWIPLYDRMIALFLETVEGQPPFLKESSLRSWTPGQAFPVEGGWPCQKYQAGWKARAESVLREIDEKRKHYGLCRRPNKRQAPFVQLKNCLEQCVADPELLRGREVGKVRLILAGYVAKHGVPGTPHHHAFREAQRRLATAPTHEDISAVVVSRLNDYPEKEGMNNPEAVLGKVSAEEALRWKMAAGTPVPATQVKKVRRCLFETVEVLVEKGIITSSEAMARVLPQITAGLRSAGISDVSLRQVYAAVYRAFRRRRSLLLLNLQSQIKIEELPWIAAVDRHRAETHSTRELSRQTLEEFVLLALTSFPQAIIPNKLLQEIRALAKGADLKLPLVDELAVDIFMGTFSNTFLRAAKQAGELLDGTLYSRYYGIDYNRVRQIPEKEVKQSWFRSAEKDEFAELCAKMAGVPVQSGKTAMNGMVIEQQQIITTHNLAVLYAGLDLGRSLRGRLPEIAKNCFVWICRRQKMNARSRHARLIMLKNTAYAWRQMIFFLSLTSETERSSFIEWAAGHLEKQPEPFRLRFSPALEGLSETARGKAWDRGEGEIAGRCFLGWTVGRHWLMDDGDI